MITEVTLRLFGRPEAVSSAVCPVHDDERGDRHRDHDDSARASRSRESRSSTSSQLEAVNRYSKTNYPLAPTLFFEFHGISQESVDEQAQAVQEIAAEHGALEFRWASTPEERATLWQARHNVLYATIAARPGAKPWTSDVCVPISRLSECILETQDDLRRSQPHRAARRPRRRRQLPPDLHGRSGRSRGNGCGQGRERAAGRARVAPRGAPARGEHGVGFGKLKYLAQEHGESLDTMRAIKRALDPHNIMNPGKLIPE